MRSTLPLAAALVAAGASAQTTPPAAPPPSSMPSPAAMSFMTMAGESDVFEISSSSIALKKSQNPSVRRYATMMIDHHTGTTNTLLAQAKAARVTPPPAVLSPAKIALIDRLDAASSAEFDRTYLTQQVSGHQEALGVHTTYARNGDTPQLRTAAKAAVPLVQRHLDEANRMLASM